MKYVPLSKDEADILKCLKPGVNLTLEEIKQCLDSYSYKNSWPLFSRLNDLVAKKIVVRRIRETCVSRKWKLKTSVYLYSTNYGRKRLRKMRTRTVFREVLVATGISPFPEFLVHQFGEDRAKELSALSGINK